MEENYKKAISKAKDLANNILQDPTSDHSKEYNLRKKHLDGINVERSWVNFWWKANRSIIYKSSAVAASLIISVFALFQLNQKESYIQPVAGKINIMPSQGSVSLKLATGEIIALDSSSKTDSRLSGVKVDSKAGEISYAEVNQEKNIGTGTLLTDQYNELTIPKGKSYSLVLSDGTKVWLNALTTIKYPVKFSKGERKVFITGEAFFDVYRDVNHPFIVHTESYDVKVLGTEFNVSAYPEEKNTSATLVSGSITIPQEDGYDIQIKAGEQYKYNRESSSVTIEQVDVELYTSWRNDIMRIEQMPLEEIVNIIKRRYDIEFKFSDEQSRYELFTGKLPLNDNLAIVLEQLSKVSNIKFQYSGGVVNITYK